MADPSVVRRPDLRAAIDQVRGGIERACARAGRRANEVVLVAVTKTVSIEAIRTATSSAAELLGLTGQIGSIEKGAYADLIGLPGDPLKDVATLSKVDFVMKGGEVVRAPAP